MMTIPTSLLLLWPWQSLAKQNVLEQTCETWIDIWGITWIRRPITGFRDHLSFKSLGCVEVFWRTLQWIRHLERNSALSRGLSQSLYSTNVLLRFCFQPTVSKFESLSAQVRSSLEFVALKISIVGDFFLFLFPLLLWKVILKHIHF